MKFIIHLVLFVYFSLSCYSNINQDSLFKAILPTKIEDTLIFKLIKAELDKNNWDNLELQNILCEKALEVSLRTNNKKLIAESYKLLGSTQTKLMQYFDAIKTLNEGYRIAMSVNDYDEAVHCLNYLALVLEQVDDIEKSIEYYSRAYKLADKCKDTYPKGAAASMMARLYFILKNNQLAKNYADKAAILFAKSKESQAKLRFSYASLYRSYAGIYAETAVYDSAFYYYRKVFNEYPDKTNLGQSLNYYYTFIFNKTKQYDSAKYYLNKIIISNDELNNYEINTQKYLAFKGLKQTDSALKYLELASSQITKIREKDARMLAARYDLKRAENDYNIKIQDEETMRLYSTIIATVIFILILSIAYIIYSRYKVINKLNNKLDLANDAKEKLFSIISHDLMNPVASLKQMLDLISVRYDKIKEEDKYKYFINMQTSSNRLFLMMDNLLSWSKLNLGAIVLCTCKTDIKQLITEEIDFQQNNIEAKQITLNIHFEIDDEVEIDANIVKVIVRNLLSNAIKFSKNASQIQITVSKKDCQLQIKVKNYGKSISQELIEKINSGLIISSKVGTNNEKGNGLGLFICKELCDVHNAKLLIDNSDGTEIAIIIPQ